MHRIIYNKGQWHKDIKRTHSVNGLWTVIFTDDRGWVQADQVCVKSAIVCKRLPSKRILLRDGIAALVGTSGTKSHFLMVNDLNV